MLDYPCVDYKGSNAKRLPILVFSAFVLQKKEMSICYVSTIKKNLQNWFKIFILIVKIETRLKWLAHVCNDDIVLICGD